MDNLTEKQSAFVSYLVREGCNPTQAARKAGYGHPNVRAYELLRNEHILQTIRKEQARILDGDLSNVAMRTLRGVMEDEKSPASARIAACRTVLEVGGYFKREQEPPLESKSPLDMSAQELEAFVKKGRDEMRKQEQILGNA